MAGRWAEGAMRGALCAGIAFAWTISGATGSSAQTTAVVQGRIVASGGDVGIENAAIVVEGHTSSLSAADGRFLIEEVPLGPQVLSIRALGYATLHLQLVVDGDMDVRIALQVQPLTVEGLTVDLTAVEVRGRVRDPELDIPLAGADVLTDQTASDYTDVRGRFDLDVWEGVPLTISVRAFGYFPQDTTVVPGEGADYRLQVSPDPLVTRMIGVEVSRIEDRSAGRRSALMRPLNREELLRWKNATLEDVLRSAYSIHLRRIRCVLVDEEQLGPGMIGPTLRTTFVTEVERIEFLFRGAMLRVYTRDFMRRMLGSGIPLRTPSYAYFPPSEPLCL